MPELPDVEVYRRYLESTALHQAIAEVHVDHRKILEGTTPQQLGAVLHGRSFEEGRRHGKHLLVRVNGGPCVHLHFGMTGRLVYHKNPESAPEHGRARFVFDNGYQLVFDNMRLLGELSLVDSIEEFVGERDLGPDALDVGRAVFVERVRARRARIKGALTNQSVVAGIGNVYADEILFQAGIHPEVAAHELDDAEADQLHDAMRRVLSVAIDAQADPARFPRDFLTSRREDGAECPRCGGRVAKSKVGGRATYVCPRCQPPP